MDKWLKCTAARSDEPDPDDQTNTGPLRAPGASTPRPRRTAGRLKYGSIFLMSCFMKSKRSVLLGLRLRSDERNQCQDGPRGDGTVRNFGVCGGRGGGHDSPLVFGRNSVSCTSRNNTGDELMTSEISTQIFKVLVENISVLLLCLYSLFLVYTKENECTGVGWTF